MSKLEDECEMEWVVLHSLENHFGEKMDTWEIFNDSIFRSKSSGHAQLVFFVLGFRLGYYNHLWIHWYPEVGLDISKSLKPWLLNNRLVSWFEIFEILKTLLDRFDSAQFLFYSYSRMTFVDDDDSNSMVLILTKTESSNPRSLFISFDLFHVFLMDLFFIIISSWLITSILNIFLLKAKLRCPIECFFGRLQQFWSIPKHKYIPTLEFGP